MDIINSHSLSSLTFASLFYFRYNITIRMIIRIIFTMINRIYFFKLLLGLLKLLLQCLLKILFVVT